MGCTVEIIKYTKIKYDRIVSLTVIKIYTKKVLMKGTKDGLNNKECL